MPFSTQQFIEIAGIKDGIVILKNGGYRIILSVSTINFALKSEQEQNSLIFQYQSFLNSLHFPIQIVIRSKRLDLSQYLRKVNDLAAKQSNELLKIQTEDYADFVGKLIDLANIMKKTFFVVIPFQPVALQNASLLGKLFNREKTVTDLRISENEFKRNSEELKQRAQVAANGLASMGLRCVQLSTEEIIELFYQIYNPEESNQERITDVEELAAAVIQHQSEKGDGQPGGQKLEEEKIDNTAVVNEVQKQQSALRQQEMLKEGERQIGMNQPEADKTSGTAENKSVASPATTSGETTKEPNNISQTNPKTQDQATESINLPENDQAT